MSNPQIHTPDANLQAITLTQNAIKHVEETINKKGSGIGIRLSTKKAGCSGLMYVVDIIDQQDANDMVFPINDNLAIYVDPKSYAFLKGTELDYVREGLNEKFSYKNPNEAGSCGCGESFIVDDDDQD